MKSISLFVFLSLFVTTTFAGDISWSGRYRFEGLSLNNPGLDSSKKEKAYMLHHMILQPKIVAADGVNIYGRFDILNSGDYQIHKWVNSWVTGFVQEPLLRQQMPPTQMQCLKHKEMNLLWSPRCTWFGFKSFQA